MSNFIQTFRIGTKGVEVIDKYYSENLTRDTELSIQSPFLGARPARSHRFLYRCILAPDEYGSIK